MAERRVSVSPSWDRGWALLALLVLAACLAHGLAIAAPFQFDDLHQIELNPAFRDIAYFPRYFTDPWVGSSTGHAIFFRPLLFSTFLIDGLVGGGSPLPYRIGSLVLLVLYAYVVRHFAICFVGQMARSLSRETITRMASLASLLVVVHPIFNETVLLASSRSSIMMASFGLLALARLLRPAHAVANRLHAVLLTSAALLTKETAVVLAPLAVLVSWLGASHTDKRRRWLASWPIIAPVLVYVLFHETIFQDWVASNSVAPMPASLANKVPPWIYPAQGGLALLGFARLFFLPIGLSLVHEVPVPSGIAMLIGYAVWPISAALGIAALRSPGALRQAGIALLWFVIALAPTTALVRMNSPLAEHRAAIAVVMPIVAVSWAIASIRSEALRRAVAIALGVALAGASMVQTIPWRSAVELWTHETDAQPRSSRAWGFLADTLYERGEIDEARKAIAHALELSPTHPIYLARAAAIELAANNPSLAAAYTQRGLSIEQNLPVLHLVEAERLAIAGNLDEAAVHAETVTRLAPSLGAGWTARGNVSYLRGEWAAAAEAYERALRIDPSDAAAAANLQKLDAKRPRIDSP